MQRSKNLSDGSSNSIGVFFVDDHKLLLDSIVGLLSANPRINIIGTAVNGIELFADYRLDNVNVLVLDMSMKEMDGIEVYKKALDLGYAGACIFLSSYDDLKLINEVMKLGASGYLTKTVAAEFLEEAIISVSEGNQYFSPDVKGKILSSFGTSPQKPTTGDHKKGILRQLTSREVEVLKLIAMEYTSDEIAKQLFIAKSTVDTHRKNLIGKLNVKNAVGLGLFAQRNGLI